MADFIAQMESDRTVESQPERHQAIPVASGDRRPLRVLLLGSKQDVIDTIKNLHRRGFAEAGDWTKPIASPESEEQRQRLLSTLPPGSYISILTKYLHHDSSISN
ncbi:hypothetical protein IQ268_21685 [Oculatella sp. LEGE 06141]|uniref:hypothetical protein n=1 Tax=Oculatella sp. LEGE 06141 TaxID=1828648 RepID=UPI00187EABFE|nr:hypothetical protein [Oculatella sp. LEGE 06141]MBE9181177.1 hypothetical protein [Oculatella sp. LEGE 06141]